MGYTTEFQGYIAINEPLLPKTLDKLAFLGEDSSEFPELTKGAPDGYCQWMLVHDYDGHANVLKWDGGEKFYDSFEWMQFIVRVVLADYTCDGVIEAQGEEMSDRWLLVVENSKITRYQGIKAVTEFLSNSTRNRGQLSSHQITVGEVVSFLSDNFDPRDTAPGFFNDDGDFEVILELR